jgi:hypothetical protein
MAANGYGEGDFDALLGYFVSKAQAIAKVWKWRRRRRDTYR